MRDSIGATGDPVLQLCSSRGVCDDRIHGSSSSSSSDKRVMSDDEEPEDGGSSSGNGNSNDIRE